MRLRLLLICMLSGSPLYAANYPIEPFKKPVLSEGIDSVYAGGFVFGTLASSLAMVGVGKVSPLSVPFISNLSLLSSSLIGFRVENNYNRFYFDHSDVAKDIMKRVCNDQEIGKYEPAFCAAYEKLRKNLNTGASIEREEQACDGILRDIAVPVSSIRAEHNRLYDDWQDTVKKLKFMDGFILGQEFGAVGLFIVLLSGTPALSTGI